MSSEQSSVIAPGRQWTLPLWGERDRDYLLAKQQELGARIFDRGFRQRAYIDSERTFPATGIERMFSLEAPRRTENWVAATGVDLSGKERKGTAIVTVAVEPRTEHREIVSARFGAWSSDEQAREIALEFLRLRPLVIYVENNAYQESLLDMIRLLASKGIVLDGVPVPETIPIYGFTTGMQKGHEEFGLPGLSTEIENGAWSYPTNALHEDCKCGRCRLEEEFLSHPFGDTTDGVMATWFAREAIRSRIDGKSRGAIRTGDRPIAAADEGWKVEMGGW